MPCRNMNNHPPRNRSHKHPRPTNHRQSNRHLRRRHHHSAPTTRPHPAQKNAFTESTALTLTRTSAPTPSILCLPRHRILFLLKILVSTGWLTSGIGYTLNLKFLSLKMGPPQCMRMRFQMPENIFNKVCRRLISIWAQRVVEPYPSKVLRQSKIYDLLKEFDLRECYCNPFLSNFDLQAFVSTCEEIESGWEKNLRVRFKKM